MAEDGDDAQQTQAGGRSESKPDRPHDALFQWTFSNVNRARSELKAILPRSLGKKVDWSTLQLVSAGTADEQLKHFGIDTLYRVSIASRPALIYLSLEHQSSVDKAMAVRKLGYWVRIIEWYIDQLKGSLSQPLPVVIPIVLYHGSGRWSAATSVQELFDPELVSDPDIARFVPHFSFLLDDLTQLSDEALRERMLDLVTTLVLWALRDGRASFQTLLESFDHWAQAMQALSAQGPYEAEALERILRYILSINGRRAPSGFAQMLAGRLSANAGKTLMTLAEQLRAEGRAEGKAEGKAEGERTVLVRLLRLKFGELDERVQARIASASEEQVLTWSERILTGNSLEQVLEG